MNIITIRDDWNRQFGRISGNTPNSLWPPPPKQKFSLRRFLSPEIHPNYRFQLIIITTIILIIVTISLIIVTIILIIFTITLTIVTIILIKMFLTFCHWLQKYCQSWKQASPTLHKKWFVRWWWRWRWWWWWWWWWRWRLTRAWRDQW